LIFFSFDLAGAIFGPTPQAKLIIFELLALFNFFTLGPLTVLLWFHIFLIYKKTTTYEYYYLRFKLTSEEEEEEIEKGTVHEGTVQEEEQSRRLAQMSSEKKQLEIHQRKLQSVMSHKRRHLGSESQPLMIGS